MLGRSLNRRVPIECTATTQEIAALRAEVDTLKRRIAAIERLLRFVHGDGSLGGSGPPPQPPLQPELRLKPIAALPGKVLVTTE
jgi:hypothetical protein